jgi:cytochrome P450
MTVDEVPWLPGADALGHARLFRDERLALLRHAGDAGPISRVRFLHRSLYLASSPETAHEILVEKARSFEKSPGIRVALHDLAGKGLFTSEGALWQKQRRLMSPLFHSGPLAGYAPWMEAVARRALARWRHGDTLDLSREMTRITMSVVAATLFGVSAEEQMDEIGEAITLALKWVDKVAASSGLVLQVTLLEAFERAIPKRFAELRHRILEELEKPRLLGPQSTELSDAIRRIDAMMRELIADRRATPQANVDLLTKLLMARDVEGGVDNGMSDRQVRDEVNTLFVAGHETTANALAWAFYLLARSPDARARVQAEADAVALERGARFDPTTVSYTTRVFKEALRLYPPLLVLPRRTLEPVEIAGRVYPERTLMFVNVYGIHMSSRVWPDPDRFLPDRFTPEGEASRPKSAWLPFGVGPRVCIGNAFALMEGPIVLATLMKHARFEVDPLRTIEVDAFATLRPKGGVPATVRLVTPPS